MRSFKFSLETKVKIARGVYAGRFARIVEQYVGYMNLNCYRVMYNGTEVSVLERELDAVTKPIVLV